MNLSDANYYGNSMFAQKSLDHVARIARFGHWQRNLANDTVRLSTYMCELMGISERQFMSLDVFLNYVHIEDVDEFKRQMDKSIADNHPMTVEYRMVRANGSICYFHGLTEPICDADGEPAVLLGIAQDITEQEVLRQKLEESRSRYRMLVENSLDAIGVLENGKWTYVNNTALKVFGAVSKNEIVGKPHFDFLHPDHHDECSLRSERILSGESVDFVEQKFIRLNGDVFYAEVVGIPFGKSGIQVIMRDITERRHTMELLLRSEKLSAVGQLAAGVAHEIRNPLTSLKGFAQLLRGTSDGATRRYTEIMLTELDRIELILNEMLLLAKPQVAVFELCNVKNIVHEVNELLHAQANMKNFIIQLHMDETPLIVHCDENQLKQVFINLIKNGMEAMPSGGNLTVLVEQVDGHVKIQVKDEGVGIPKDQVAKLGEAFFTTKETGTGLGLMMSQRIIASHKGSLHVSSEVGKGTTIDVLLPLVSETL